MHKLNVVSKTGSKKKLCTFTCMIHKGYEWGKSTKYAEK